VLPATTRQKTTNSDTLFSLKEGRSASKTDISSTADNPNQVRLIDITQPKPDVILDQTLICTGQSQGSVEGSTQSYWMMESIPHHKTFSTCHHVLPGTMLPQD
jgi:hypothetical protein